MSIAPKNDPWIPQFKLNPQARIRLFCFPYAGGTTYTFRSWLNFLPQTIELCAIELPGRYRRLHESPYKDINLLLSALSIALVPYLDRPFAFFGHSMGGIVSFELTRLIKKNLNLSPVHLFISGHRAAQIPDRDPPIHNLDNTKFKQEIIKLGGTPQEVIEHEEMMELLMPTLRADFQAIENYQYQPEPPLDIPITVFGGKSDPRASQADLEAWQEHTSADFSLYMFDGGHFFIEEHREIILDHLVRQISNQV